jgi:Lipocalin-like domain
MGYWQTRHSVGPAKMVFVALSTVIVLGVSGNAAAAQVYATGAVKPCDLAGVNPAYHPDVFGDPAVAASLGFVRSRDGTWQVRPDLNPDYADKLVAEAIELQDQATAIEEGGSSAGQRTDCHAAGPRKATGAGFCSSCKVGEVALRACIGDLARAQLPRRLSWGDTLPRIGSSLSVRGRLWLYVVEGDKITHKIDVSWNQTWTGDDQVRFSKIEGDTLTITTAINKNPRDGREGCAVAVFVRAR